ncbi:transposase [Streptomyces sp. NPDC001536]|uniref:transposase n=1 Tax=Streptomyces sp. NPDC001536 TaxID=3364583 RepID=UPI0036889212
MGSYDPVPVPGAKCHAVPHSSPDRDGRRAATVPQPTRGAGGARLAHLPPALSDHSRQAKADSGFDKTAFTIDWGNEQAICPRGAMSASWTTLNISGHTYFQARFAEADCRPCPDRARCTSSAARSRSVAVLPRLLHEIQMRNRLDQQTEQRQRRYAIRAGIEATLSQNVRAHGLRRTRYRGLAKTHVQHVLTAMACNLGRLADWHYTTSSARRAPRFRTLCNTAGFTIN